MASMNPIAGAFLSANQKPTQEPHARGLHRPTHKHKVAHKGRPPIEMPRGHGLRKSAVGRDTLVSGNKHPKLPGKLEPSGIVKAVPGPKRFGDQGR